MVREMPPHEISSVVCGWLIGVDMPYSPMDPVHKVSQQLGREIEP